MKDVTNEEEENVRALNVKKNSFLTKFGIYSFWTSDIFIRFFFYCLTRLLSSMAFIIQINAAKSHTETRARQKNATKEKDKNRNFVIVQISQQNASESHLWAAQMGEKS